jgi:hypothetical protein
MMILKEHDSYRLVNKGDLERLVENSLEMISSINHECNLLELPLSKILRNFLRNRKIILFTT